MKNTVLKTAVFFTFVLFSSTILSQDIALSNSIKPYANYYNFSSKVVIKNAVLDEGLYVYEYKKRKINVEIKDGYYYEYMHNNQFLKAKIDWLSEFKYKLTIVKIQTEQYSFKKGDSLTSEITKIEGNEYYYKSFFEGKVVRGNFIKIVDANRQ